MSTSGPFDGIADFLKPNPPAEIPEPQAPESDVSAQSLYSEPLDVDKIKENMLKDRPLKLFIPAELKQKFPGDEFRIINSIPSEIAAARNVGWREVTHPEAIALFSSLVAGTDKNGAAYRPILVGRPKALGDDARKINRQKLASLYAGLDPKNKELEGKYTSNVREGGDASKGQFSGAAFRIRA